MKTLNYKIIALFFILVTSFANAQDDYTKKFSKEFDVNKSDAFEISNRFGNINIENTNADKITINAEVIVKARSQEKADKILNKISISIEKNAGTISAITNIDNMSTRNSSFEINYSVTMPAYLNTKLSNRYGNVTINELHGQSNLAVRYGSLNINKMLDDKEKPLSSIELGYCENSRINEANWAKIAIKYSKIEIGKATALAVSSEYSKIEIGSLSSIVAECAYDNYEIGNVKNIKMKSKYSNIEVDRLTSKFKIDNSYGKISVSDIPNGFNEINVESKYAKIDLGIANDANFKINAQSKYADIRYNKLQIQQKIREDNSTQISGYMGTEAAEAIIKIDTKYGDVDLRK